MTVLLRVAAVALLFSVCVSAQAPADVATIQSLEARAAKDDARRLEALAAAKQSLAVATKMLQARMVLLDEYKAVRAADAVVKALESSE